MTIPVRALPRRSTTLPALVGLLTALALLLPGAAAAQTAVPFGGTVTADVPADGSALLTVDAPGPGFLSVIVRSLDGVDLTLAVTDADGQALPDGSSDQDIGGDYGDERVVVEVPRGGAYGVRVETLDYAPSRIAVGASFIASELAVGPVDPDGSPSDATPLAVGEDHDDFLGPDDPRDWFRIVPEADGILTVLTRAPYGDLVLEVYAEGEYAEPVDRSDQDQGGVAGNEAVTLDVTAGVPLLVRVMPLFGADERMGYRIATGLVGG